MRDKSVSGILIAIIMLTGLAIGIEAFSSEEGKTMEKQQAKEAISLTKIPFETIDGKASSLEDFDGKVLLLVNVASKCGFTKQYAGLEELYRKYKDSGLVVIGFPANNFGGQEPGTNEEIKTFCQTKFDVTFPMMAKISVKGADIHPLFQAMTEESNLKGEIKWNFSKFLIDRKGHLVARYPSQTEPNSEELMSKIKELL